MFLLGSSLAERYYYLGPWIWSDELNAFDRPAGTVGAIDLRGDCTKGGLGFFATDHELGKDYERYGTILDESLRPAARSKWADMLGVGPLASATLLDVLCTYGGQVYILHFSPAHDIRSTLFSRVVESAPWGRAGGSSGPGAERG